MSAPSWYRPNTIENRSAKFSCPVCKLDLPGKHFVHLSEAHPDLYPDGREKVRKKVIDLRQCNSCRLRAWQRDNARALRAKQDQEREEAYKNAIERGIPIDDPRLVPPKLRTPRILNGAGRDPVLHWCAITLQQSYTKRDALLARTEAMLDKERVAGCEDEAFMEAYLNSQKALYKLFSLRIRVAEGVRERRKLDLQSMTAAADPVRISPLYYISTEDKAKLMRATKLANKVRVTELGKRNRALNGRPFVWMPTYTFTTHDRSTRNAIRQAWSLHLARANNTAKKARTYLRSRASAVSRRTFTMKPEHTKLEYDVLTFTMEQFYLKVLDCAEKAIERIEDAIDLHMLPQSYCDPMDKVPEQREIRHWEELAPSLLVRNIRDMHTGFDDSTRYKMDTFSRHHTPKVLYSVHSDDPTERMEESKRKRNRYQIANWLDHNNMPLPVERYD